MIEVKGLTKFYKQIRAIEDVSFTVEKGRYCRFSGSERRRQDYHNEDYHGFYAPPTAVLQR